MIEIDKCLKSKLLQFYFTFNLFFNSIIEEISVNVLPTESVIGDLRVRSGIDKFDTVNRQALS